MLLWCRVGRGPQRPLRETPAVSVMRALPLLALLFLLVSPHHIAAYPNFQHSDTTFNHLAQDGETGFLYVGAVDFLFQLSSDLELTANAQTGPQDDSPDCLPFKDKKDCPQAHETNNANKVLVVNKRGHELITCGQVFQGICEKRSLESVANVLYQTVDPGDNQFVAANDAQVTTVALASNTTDGRELLFVGRGMTAKLSGGIPPITVRQLNRQPFFSNEGLGKLVVSDFSDYNNHFMGIFHHAGHVYFLFFRRGPKAQLEYASYVARVCDQDVPLYSYVEVQLVCRDESGKNYNLAQAAHLEAQAEENATLFVVFAAGLASTPTATQETALCAFSLKEVNARLERARALCYTKAGRNERQVEEAAIEYGVTSSCGTLPQDSPKMYPCGGEHTPSPIASRVPLVSRTLLVGVPGLSAVAAVEESGSTIAFLGDTQGNLHKVFLTSTSGDVYSTWPVDAGSPVNADLLLDTSKRHLYVMTGSQVTKIPIAECSKFAECSSCMEARDPFCGWCVLQGRCTERGDCQTTGAQDRWLWSYKTEERCLKVQELHPANLSRTHHTEMPVILTVPGLPALDEGFTFDCSFGDYKSQAEVLDTEISCEAPPTEQIPPSQQGMDHVIVSLAVMFGDVIVASTDFAFYDCAAVMALAVSSPCRSCVSSPWCCHWCVAQYTCTPMDSCNGEGPLIYSSTRPNGKLSGPEACPSVQGVQGTQLFPVGIDRELDLLGENLDLLQDQDMDYQCVLEVEGNPLRLRAQVEQSSDQEGSFVIHCATHAYHYSLLVKEHPVNIHLIEGNGNRIDNQGEVQVILYNCLVGHSDCSHCQASDAKYSCAWCGEGQEARCLYRESCPVEPAGVCPTPFIDSIYPQTGVLEGGLRLTITGSDLGQRVEDLEVTVAGLPCTPDQDLYKISTRIVCVVSASEEVRSGHVAVSVEGREPGVSSQDFIYQNPVLHDMYPQRGPMAGGTLLTISGTSLITGSGITAVVGGLPCAILDDLPEDQIVCRTNQSMEVGEFPVSVFYGKAERRLDGITYEYTEDPVITSAAPTTSFYGGGRPILVEGINLDVVESPQIAVLLESNENGSRRKRPRRGLAAPLEQVPVPCTTNSSTLLVCPSPQIPAEMHPVDVIFILDNVRADFRSITGEPFGYMTDPTLRPLNKEDPTKPYSLKPGNVLDIEGDGLDLGISKKEVIAMIGNGVCTVKTLTKNHLYCEPPLEAPQPLEEGALLPEFVVRMGNLNFRLGSVKYETEGQSSFPQEAKIGLVVGAAVVVFVVVIIIFMYRRKSKQAMRDYKKVLVQLENLEISVGDQCRKEFTDLMTEMMDLTSDLEGTGIPFLDYKTYIERIFFPGHTGSPLRRNLDVPEARRQTVEQGLNQLSNLLNNKLFLTKLICTLEEQQTFSQRDRCHVASLLTLALHGKLEYLTEIMTTLLATLAEQYVVKNPKLMLRRTETMVEKLLTNWMSICLYSFLREAAGEPLYLLFRAIKYQVDKGPVDAVTGKAKRTLNDSRLLREDIEYRAMPLTVFVKSGSTSETQRVPARVLDTDTITQVKEKILDQVYKGMPFSQRPSVHSLDLEWRSGVAGHLTLSDEDLTSVTQNHWKRLNTLSHYKVPDGATVALIPRLHNNLSEGSNLSFVSGEKTPMLEDGDEGGLRTWHLVKSTEEPEVPKHRRSSSLRERERAKAIPEIYLTRLLSMKGTLQKFVDDSFQVILGVNRPVPIAVKYFFDFLDDLAEKHGIEEQETVHIWKTHSLLLRFWVLILKNPQMIFDVQVSDNVDAILCVIAQTFIDSCTISEHKVGRDSPVNKLLYAREIPRYKQLVEKYYADIRQTVPAGYQEMNSSLTELSGVSKNHVTDLNCLVALQELYNYISKYYDQIITALDEDIMGQKMQLAYRLQQIAALVENKVTDL
ncbi:plexin-B3 isoform X1 [Ambystoma mexicanum]|uniref:plexin-B3 isoform X1 n=1 Tax=Ambystoma mexicanum TaxID=8296 RepID=UPI0037E96976